jgi:cytochrome b561
MTGMPNIRPDPYLAVHMPLGLTILAVTVYRFLMRSRLPQPAPASAGNAFLDGTAKGVHHLLYLLVALIAISGISLSRQTGLIPIVFGGSGAALPPDFFAFRARAFHGLLSRALLVTVGVHVAAALYHQIVLKDRLLSRMWWGNQPPTIIQ